MKSWITLFFLLVFIGSALLFNQHANDILVWIKSLGMVAPIFFCLFYIIGTLLFMPTLVITFAGGAVFGPVLGTILNLIGASTGATVAFLVSRYLVNHKMRQNRQDKISQLIDKVNKRGWTFLALLRLVPILPFNIVNYGMGLTTIKLRDYVLITVVFLLPPEILYTYTGYIGSHAILEGSVMHPAFILSLACMTVLIFIAYDFLKRFKGVSKTCGLDKAE